MDAESGQVTRLYHPRQDEWAAHFYWQGPVLAGRTPVGRVTTDVLNINLPERVEHRRVLIESEPSLDDVKPPEADRE